MFILGINAYHGDVSAVLVRDGELVAAVEEERFRRIKHVAGFPHEAIRACLAMAGIRGRDIDARRGFARPARQCRTQGLVRRHGAADRPVVEGPRARTTTGSATFPTPCARRSALGPADPGPRIHWVEHHPAHLASTFFVSPFDDAAVCAIDGFGDFVSTSWAIGRGSSLDVIDRTYFPHSLGLLYLAITQYLGFTKYGDEFKVMGLAPYGVPDQPRPCGRSSICCPAASSSSTSRTSVTGAEASGMTWNDGEPTLEPVFSDEARRAARTGAPAGRSADGPSRGHRRVAPGACSRTASSTCSTASTTRTRIPRLCLAGGCAMNSVANGKIRERTPFTDVYIQPAAGDNGTALGAAY